MTKNLHAQPYLLHLLIALSEETPSLLTPREAFFLALEFVLADVGSSYHAQAADVRRRFQVAAVAPPGVTWASL